MMNKYMEAIGFKKIRIREQMEKLSTDTILHFDERQIYKNENGAMVGSFQKACGPDMGLVVTGEFDEKGNFHPTSTNPYLKNSKVSSYSYIEIEKKRMGEEYAGCCDDFHFGSAIVFHLTNAGEYMAEMTRPKNRGSGLKKDAPLYPGDVRFSAFSVDGRILLPVMKNEFEAEEISRRTEQHARLSEMARQGDDGAVEDLAEMEFNAMEELHQRFPAEDVFTIVDTSMLPSGMEADQYRVLGYIMECSLAKNSQTGEPVWQLFLMVCGISMRVAIHADRLRGYPKPGRRFHGNVWLCGEVGLYPEEALKK